MDKKLKDALAIRDMSIKLYDNVVFRDTNESLHDPNLRAREKQESFAITKLLQKQSLDLLLSLLDGYLPVVTTEEFFIEPGETKEIATNLSSFEVKSVEDNKNLEFTSEGIISTYGYLSFSLHKDFENGNKIMVTNNVPKEVHENFKHRGYHYCDPSTTKYFGPGIYWIKTDTMIGIMGYNNEISKEQNKSMESDSRKEFLRYLRK